MNSIDRYCLDCFPDMLGRYDRAVLEEASDCGTYVFHEDYFLPYIYDNKSSVKILIKFGFYVEYLASSPNHYLNYLAQVGIIEGLINLKCIEIMPYLGVKGLACVKGAGKNVKFDLKPWLAEI